MPDFLPILLIILAYFLGSASAAIITCKLMGKDDPRTQGDWPHLVGRSAII